MKTLFILGVIGILFTACSPNTASCKTAGKRNKYFNSLQFGTATAHTSKHSSYKRKH